MSRLELKADVIEIAPFPQSLHFTFPQFAAGLKPGESQSDNMHLLQAGFQLGQPVIFTPVCLWHVLGVFRISITGVVKPQDSCCFLLCIGVHFTIAVQSYLYSLSRPCQPVQRASSPLSVTELVAVPLIPLALMKELII